MSRIILCDSDWKQTEMLWEFVFDIECGDRQTNHGYIKRFTNIYITKFFILLATFGSLHIYFPSWWNTLGPIRHVTRRCLVNFSEWPTVIASTHDTKFTLCSEISHHIFKFKWTPPQPSWQPVLKASLLQCLLHLWSYKNDFSNQMRGHCCATQRCLFGRELSVGKKVPLPLELGTMSRASLWGKKWMWWRLANPRTTRI